MIKNEKQYHITKSRLNEFNDMLESLLKNKQEDVDPIYFKIETDAIKSQINQFEKEIKEYEALKEGEINYIYVESLPALYEALIKARIVRGWTQAKLAKKLDLKEQQIQRYELCNYSTASITRLNEIASVLDIDIKPIKVKIKDPIFVIPADVDNEIVNKLREDRTLLYLNN